jgi:hypothetical protein
MWVGSVRFPEGMCGLRRTSQGGLAGKGLLFQIETFILENIISGERERNPQWVLIAKTQKPNTLRASITSTSRMASQYSYIITDNHSNTGIHSYQEMRLQWHQCTQGGQWMQVNTLLLRSAVRQCCSHPKRRGHNPAAIESLPPHSHSTW